jgi:hypothetical protein
LIFIKKPKPPEGLRRIQNQNHNGRSGTVWGETAPRERGFRLGVCRYLNGTAAKPFLRMRG